MGILNLSHDKIDQEQNIYIKEYFNLWVIRYKEN